MENDEFRKKGGGTTIFEEQGEEEGEEGEEGEEEGEESIPPKEPVIVTPPSTEEPKSKLELKENTKLIDVNDSLPSRLVIAIYSQYFFEGKGRNIEEDREIFAQPLLFSKIPENFADLSSKRTNVITKGMTKTTFNTFKNELMNGRKFFRIIDEGESKKIKFFDEIMEEGHDYNRMIYATLKENTLIQVVTDSIKVTKDKFALMTEDERFKYIQWIYLFLFEIIRLKFKRHAENIMDIKEFKLFSAKVEELNK